MQMELLTSHCAALAPGGVEAVRARCACFARGYLAANPPGSASVAAVDLLAFKSAAADPATFQRLGGACLSRAAAALPAPG
jgi:hypothetical protein